MEWEVGRGAITFTNLSLKRSTSSTATANNTSIVVVSHRATFAFKAVSVKSNLTILTSSNTGIQDLILVKHKFVNGIHAFRNFRERKGVVVVKDSVVSICRDLHEGERGGFSASLLPNIRDLGSVELNRHRPDVSSTVTFGDGHKLTLDDTSFSAIDSHVQGNIIVTKHLERKFLTSNREHAIVRSEVKNVHSVGATFSVHVEVEGLHPSTGRTNAEVKSIDDHFVTIHVLHMELVGATATTSCNVELDVGTVRSIALTATETRSYVVRIGSVSVAIPVNTLITRARSSTELVGAARIATSAIETSNQQVARTIIRERGVEGDGHPAWTRG